MAWRYPLLWTAFTASLVWGCALLLRPDAASNLLGLAFIVGPIFLFGFGAMLYYAAERRRARPPSQG